MQAVYRQLVTIITEAVLESELTRQLEQLGARGYTITEARGKGSRGIRDAGWDEVRNIRIEVICEEAVAEAIMDHLQAHYYDNFAMVIFSSEIRVRRANKF
ncbi:MAG: transcriptional regulator [Aeromonadaceae bacterium]|jgi:nitrogen regulatory protein PII|nr:transcriptional regulator [Aeromonas sp.]